MKNFIDDLKKEYSLITTPSTPEVLYISFLVLIFSFLISLLIVGVDFIIGLIINSILFT
jgi:preprotein translocase SecE subunit